MEGIDGIWVPDLLDDWEWKGKGMIVVVAVLRLCSVAMVT